MNPRVIVQIITYRTEGIEAELDDLFASLARVQAPPGGWMLAIIDQPSALGNLREYLETKVKTRSGVDLPEVFCIYHDENLGFAGGHMMLYNAVKARNPEFVYLLNQDAYVDANVLTSAVQYAEQHANTPIVQSRIMRAQAPNEYNSAGNAMHFLGFGFSLASGARHDASRSIDVIRGDLPMFYASGAGVLIRTSLFAVIGDMFAPSYFMYHDDLDLCWRARLAGYDIGYDIDSIIYHRYEFSRSMKKFYWMERNRHLTNFTNYELRTLLFIAPAMIVMEVGTLIFAFRSGWWREKVRAWGHFVFPSTWRGIYDRRRDVQRFRTVSDQRIMQYMCGVITAQEVNDPIVTKGVNPVFSLYFRIVARYLVR